MKTDKLFYRIFLLEPNLVAELIPGLPPNCRFDYVAPVLKERERRLDGVLLPLGDDPSLPLVFLEAQMQGNPGFYRRFFAQVFLYLEQYKVRRPWRGLLLFPRRTLNFGEEDPYQGVLATQVERFYLEDLIPLQELTPNLALLRLLVLSEEEAPENARRLLAQGGTEREFRRRLDWVCRGERPFALPNLSLEAIREMLDITINPTVGDRPGTGSWIYLPNRGGCLYSQISLDFLCGRCLNGICFSRYLPRTQPRPRGTRPQ